MLLTRLSGLTVHYSIRQGLILAFSLVSGLVGAESALQASPTPVTDYVVTPDNNGDSNISRVPSPEERAVADPTHSPEDYISAIEQIEADEGAYGSQLPQHLMGLGLNLQEQGDHQEAIDLFKRAIHVTRINEGLYNLNQVPMLERLIESHVARGEWEDANDRHQYLYWLHRRNYGDDDPRMLPVIDKLSSWHLNAYALDASAGLFHHLINAHNLFKLAVDIIDTNYGSHDLRLIDALRGLTVSNYYLATYQAKSSKGFQMTTNASSGPSAEERARLDQYIINSYSSGKKAITRMVDVYANNPESPPAATVKAKVELGDWYLLFNKWHSALNIYQEAYDTLIAQNASEKEIKRLFGKPIALPDLPLIDTQLPNHEEDPSYVLVRFNVTPYGRARNIEILESNPPDKVRIRSRVRKSLKVAKFRPRFENGAPALTENLVHRYLFPHEN